MRAKISTQHRPQHHPAAPAPAQGPAPAEAASAAASAPVPPPAEPAPALPTSPTTGPITREELGLAHRNHEALLEALRWPLTPPGLHYVLTHYDVPDLDPVAWRLTIGGAVEHPFELTLSDLMRRPRETVTVTLECAGNGRSRLEPRPISQPWDLGGFGTAEWTGTPLAPLLAEADLDAETVELVFTGHDRGIQGDIEQDYARSLTVTEATAYGVLLAYEMNGRPLPPQHGFPVRLVVPGWYGMTSVKWLRSIEAVTEPFTGYQQAVTYVYRQDADDAGTPVQRIRVRALMVPPGIPDFLTRQRTLEAGPTMLRGRAWSGSGPISGVEVGIDGVWLAAHVDPPVGPHAWQGWQFPWVATPGRHELACRATDAAGNVQPLEAEWNLGGMGNNGVQTMAVEVRESGA